MSTTSARALLIPLAIAGLVSLANPGIALAQLPPIPRGDITIELELVADGLTSPVFATNAGDRSRRLFVVDQAGLIRIIDSHGFLLPDPFLDLTSVIVQVNPFFDERGLLGLAFHPNYRKNGRFFVRYSAPRNGDPSEPCFGTSRGCHAEVLSEFRVSGDPNIADPTSERVLFRIDEPQFNHNAGSVAFGPPSRRGKRHDDHDHDGDDHGRRKSKRESHQLLYFSLGDGGGAHDGLADTPPSHGPTGNGQNVETALGTVLRIDVDKRPDPGLPYAIPKDNPLVGRPGLDEIYAYGLRNPYRFSFDDGPGGDGRLFLADVGQSLFEEINIIEKGGNYGWVITEGFFCFDPFNPDSPPMSCPGVGPLGEPLLNPVASYAHQDGIAVVGGFVYRGRRFPELVGKYVFGDFSRSFVPGNGRLFWLNADGALSQIFEFKFGPGTSAPLGLYVLGFGEDETGELYVLTSENLGPSGSTGQVFRIVRP